MNGWMDGFLAQPVRDPAGISQQVSLAPQTPQKGVCARCVNAINGRIL